MRLTDKKIKIMIMCLLYRNVSMSDGQTIQIMNNKKMERGLKLKEI